LRVSAALIVRNEASFLFGCLDSLEGKVDEIVVVDTGSTDGTQEIAASRGVRLLHFPWIDDFAAARNHALDAASGDWILYIDADERLDPPVALSDIVSKPGHAGFMMKFRPKVDYSPYHEMRLFKSDPRIRFEGRIHERVLPSIERVCRSDGLLIGQTDAAIPHLGYEDDQSRKHARNLPLLIRAVEDDPERVYLWWHLGETLGEAGRRREAIEALRRGIDVAGKTATPRARIEASLAAQSLARLHLDAGEAAEAADVVEEGLGLRPEDPALLLLRGRAWIDLGRLEEAFSLLSSLALEHPERFFDPDMAYDLRILSEWPNALAGLAAFRMGRFQTAAESYGRAAAVAPREEQYRVKARLAAARAGTARARLKGGPGA
jgi:tetratricopeptide (TPR) repeat protein